MPFQLNHTSDVQPVEQIPGGFRRVLGDGRKMMLIEWRFEPGATVPEHSHPHEQTGYVISGEMLFTIEGVERSVPLGTGYLIPSHVPHSARFEEFTVLVDIFSPPREDYRETSASAPSYMLGTLKPPTRKSVRKPKTTILKRSVAKAKLPSRLKRQVKKK